MVEFQHVLDGLAVLGVLLDLEHVHEGAVVHAVHAERPDEIPLHHPERLGQEQRVRAPRPRPGPPPRARTPPGKRVELLAVHAVFGPGGNAAAKAAKRKPEALEMLLGQGHGCIETDDRETAGNMQNGLNYRLAHLGIR